MKIAILGFGREGQSILKFLKKNKIKGNIFILDKNQKVKIPSGIKSCLGKNYLSELEKFDIIYRSPGIPYNLPEIQRAVKKGMIFSSATKIFFEKCPCKIIGVTGTKGKGTTSTLIYKILKADKKDAFLIGNMGSPCLDILPKLKKKSIIVFELSSFQLQDLKKSPQIAVVLDIFPDHLDIHKNLKEYLEAKTNIARYQKQKDRIFYFANHLYSQKIAARGKAKKIPVFNKSSNLFKSDDLKIKGPHNLKNAMMAAAVAQNLNISKKIIKKIISNFKGLEHRLEFIGKVYPHTYPNHSLCFTKNGSEAASPFILETSKFVNGIGVEVYNDSASTNPGSAAAAIHSFTEPQILIAGGKDKNLNFTPLVKALKNSSVKMVLLFGENKNKIKEKIKNIRPVIICPDLKTALEKALEIAYNGDVIVFSPASASFDMFKDYKDRGEVFEKLVRKLKR